MCDERQLTPRFSAGSEAHHPDVLQVDGYFLDLVAGGFSIGHLVRWNCRQVREKGDGNWRRGLEPERSQIIC